MKKAFFYFIFYLLLIFFVYRSLLFHISTNLPDWRDHALADWIMNQNIQKITTFNFSNFFDTNAFYPHKYSLLFSDLLLPQSIIDLPFLEISKNPILSYNIVFFIILILNYLSSFLLWKNLFKSQTVAFLGSILFIFSPFFHMEYSHIQMLTLWPLLLCLYFLFKNRERPNFKNIIIAGILLSIQFLASVYLSIFLIFTIAVFFISELILKSKIKTSIRNFFIIMFIFCVLDGIFIKSYVDMQKYYQAKRDLGQYITYSANISDYIFTNPINSLVHNSALIAKWNKLDKNMLTRAAFPGFTLFLLALIGLFSVKKIDKILSFQLNLDFERLFFLLLIIFGFLFSLGPRLLFNGYDSLIIAPYAIFLKTIPFFQAARAPVRWSLLFYFGLIYFALLTIKRLYQKGFFYSSKVNSFLLTFLFFIIIFAEYVPLNFSTEKKPYINADYTKLKNLCSSKPQVLLEIPISHLDVYPNIIEGVTYISTVELSSVYHHCNLVNGYSGYDLASFYTFRDKIYQDIYDRNAGTLLLDLKKSNVNIVKINTKYLSPSLKKATLSLLPVVATQSGITFSNDLFFIK